MALTTMAQCNDSSDNDQLAPTVALTMAPKGMAPTTRTDGFNNEGFLALMIDAIMALTSLIGSD